ncbi:MAG: ATP-binding cassette domain-containing protein [Spirochaetales bacterium]|nr:ATP-binding cassette domain-containing protein [Spirochaetales bacterium]MCF7938183.1 ATP-binding cassette domain-containing protein [Spirochaetales bacterium]
MNAFSSASPSSPPLLEVRDLKLHFPVESGIVFRRRVGAVRAVDGVSFSMDRGETLGLVGESGCGKSTTARAVAQLLPPTAGDVLLEGASLPSMGRDELLRARRNIQLIFQDPYASLDPRMTAGNIIAEPLIIYRNRGIIELEKRDINRRVEELMERVGLSRHFRNRYPHEFSGGQRQRIGIARALALGPRLILADEPVSALDVSIQAQILNLLSDLQREMGIAFLFIAHDLAVIEYIASRVAVMYLGRIVELADSAALYSRPLHPYTQALLSAAPIPDPDLERSRRRIILSGDVPSPDLERHGCYFYDRCPKRMDICKTRIPELTEVAQRHQVACFLHHDPL